MLVPRCHTSLLHFKYTSVSSNESDVCPGQGQCQCHDLQGLTSLLVSNRRVWNVRCCCTQRFPWWARCRQYRRLSPVIQSTSTAQRSHTHQPPSPGHTWTTRRWMMTARVVWAQTVTQDCWQFTTLQCQTLDAGNVQLLTSSVLPPAWPDYSTSVYTTHSLYHQPPVHVAIRFNYQLVQQHYVP